MANTVRRVYFGASGLYVAYKIANYFMGNGGDKKEEEKDPVQEFADSIQGASAQAMWLNLVGIGDELGLFQAFIDKGAMTSDELAAATGMDARYAKEWCLTIAAFKTLDYEEATNKFSCPPPVKTSVESDTNLCLASATCALILQRNRLKKCFMDGTGIGWGEHDECLFSGTRRFFRPFYEGALVSVIPDVIKNIMANPNGCLMADVGCGQGLSCRVLSKAFPNMKIKGYDLHQPSIDVAKELSEGFDNIEFQCQSSESFYNRTKFDVVCFFDCFHDMAVAGEAAKQAYNMTGPNGKVFLIELLAAENDSVSEQLALPTCGMYGCFSCHVCLACSKCNNGDALGTLCPTSKHRELFQAAGFKTCESLPSPANGMGFRVIVVEK